MFNILKRRVHVTFVDDAKNETLGEGKFELSDLPDSFLESTTLDVGDENWSVVQADPPLKEKFAKSKKLTVRLRRIEQVSTETLLYSLPTIADPLPASQGRIADDSEMVIAEDDWRQIECVSKQLEDCIREEMADIGTILRDARESVGFTKIHVRKRIPQPLLGATLPRSYLEGQFGPASAAVRFHGSGARISDAFCHDVGDHWLLYGTTQKDQAITLALAPSAHTNGALATPLRHLCDTHSLLLVDWCGCRFGAPGSDDFAAILRSGLEETAR